MRRRAGVFAILIASCVGIVSAQDHRVFTGHWIGNLAQSSIRANANIQRFTLDVAVAADLITLTDHTIDASGRDVGYGTTAFRTDGIAYPHDELAPGLTVVARWSGDRVLETVLTRPNVVDRITYEVSADGTRLTTKTSGPLGTQTFVFDRN